MRFEVGTPLSAYLIAAVYCRKRAKDRCRRCFHRRVYDLYRIP